MHFFTNAMYAASLMQRWLIVMPICARLSAEKPGLSLMKESMMNPL